MILAVRLALDTIIWPVIPVAIGVGVAATTRSVHAKRAITTVGLAAGIVVAHLVDVGVPHVPPIDTIGWIPIAIAFAMLGLLFDRNLVARSSFLFAITALAIWLVARPVWTMREAPWLVLAAAIAVAISGAHEVATRRMHTAAASLALAMTMASTSILCLVDHSALLAQVLGGGAAVVGASGLVALRFEPAKTSTAIATLSTIVVLTYARLYATISAVSVALIVVSALAPAVVALLPLRRSMRGVLSVVAALAIGVLAIGAH